MGGIDGILSDEEINALLNGIDQDDTDLGKKSKVDGNFQQLGNSKESETEEFARLLSVSMESISATFANIVNVYADITEPKIEIINIEDLIDKSQEAFVFIQCAYWKGLKGKFYTIFEIQDMKDILQLISKEEDLLNEFNSQQLGKIKDIAVRMMESSSYAMGAQLRKKVQNEIPVVSITSMNDDEIITSLKEGLGDQFVMVTFTLRVGENINSEMIQLYPISVVKEALKVLSGFHTDHDNQSKEKVSGFNQEINQVQSASKSMFDQINQGVTQRPYEERQNENNQMSYTNNQSSYPDNSMTYANNQGSFNNAQMPYTYGHIQGFPDTNAQPVQFQAFNQMANQPMMQAENINLIKDVPLDVTVELGRTSKSIKDILDIAPGSIIELDKIAGEPVDVLVNGKLVAKGEVVVIEECFGVRVTEIIK